MKILMTGYTVPQSTVPGTSRGIAKYIYYLGKEFVNLGHNTTLIIRDDFKPKEQWIRTIYSPKNSWLYYPAFLSYKTIKEKADIFFSDYVYTGLPFIIFNKKPSVISIHDAIPFTYNFHNLTLKDKSLTKWYKTCFNIIKSADIITVLSENSKKQIINLTDIDEYKIRVIPCGVDKTMFYPMKKTKNKKIRIGYMGGIDGRKNVNLLLKTFMEIEKNYENVELHLPCTKDDVEKDYKEIKNIIFDGFIPDYKINQFLNSLDIFVYPSLQEGFGLPPLEAMACGLPVIASNISSMPEILGDFAILAKPDTENFYRAISKLIENKKMRESYGKMGLERAGQLTWKKSAQKAIGVFEELI